MERPNWCEYFMTQAKVVAMRSQDPVTQVGCVIVDQDNHIVATGYNGMPKSLQFSWNKNSGLDNKNLFVVHAEVNAILHATRSVVGCTAYVTLFPCNECAKILIQAGVKKIVYLSDKYHDKLSAQASRAMFEQAGVLAQQYRGRTFNIVESNNSNSAEAIVVNNNLAKSI